MKKDKEWFIKELIGHEIGDYGNYYNGGYEDGLAYALELAHQLDEPEKVVIPQIVADEFDYNKKPYWEVDEAKDVAHILKCAFGNEGKPSEFLDWVRENPEDYVMAVRNGYEVEKEKLYVVELINNNLMRCLAYDLVDKVFFISQTQEERLNKFKKRFTEQEIKDYDERFWPFAVEVTE